MLVHGPAWPAVASPGPSFPAEAFTRIPAAYASRNASSTPSVKALCPAADREVDHVDLVDDRLADRGDAVRLEAALVEADPVADHVRAGSHAAGRSAVDPPHLRRVDEVARGRGQRVRPVAVGVPRRTHDVGVGPDGVAVLAGFGSEVRRVRVRERVGADHLVVTGEGGVVRVTGEPELAAVRTAGRAREPLVLEHRVLGPDAGVEVRDDDSLAGQHRTVELVPDRLGADELVGLLHGERLRRNVALDRGDAVDREERADLVGRQLEGESAVGQPEPRPDGRLRDPGVHRANRGPLDRGHVRR